MFGPRVGSTLIRPTRLMGPAPYTKYFPVRNSPVQLSNILLTIQYIPSYESSEGHNRDIRMRIPIHKINNLNELDVKIIVG